MFEDLEVKHFHELVKIVPSDLYRRIFNSECARILFHFMYIYGLTVEDVSRGSGVDTETLENALDCTEGFSPFHLVGLDRFQRYVRNNYKRVR